MEYFLHPKKKKTKGKFDPSKYEGFSLGPLSIERYGRSVFFRNTSSPHDFAKFKEQLKGMLPQTLDEIQSQIHRIDEIVDKYEPFELLAYVTLKNSFADPETYSESTHDGKEFITEYAQSIILSSPRNESYTRPTEDICKSFEESVFKLYNSVSSYFIFEGASKDDRSIKDDIKVHSLSRFLFVRGNAYIEHIYDTFIELFSPFDDKIKEIGLPSSENIVKIVQSIFKQIEDKLHNYGSSYDTLKVLQSKFADFLESQEAPCKKTIEELGSEFRQLPEIVPLISSIDQQADPDIVNVFKIDPSDDIPASFLRLISAGFGDNEGFRSFKKTPLWPTNDSIIYEKPVIQHDGSYYCFNCRILGREIQNIIGEYIRSHKRTLYDRRYLKSRKTYLELKSLTYLNSLLPGSKSFSNLFYRRTTNGKSECFETDGIILYDSYLFIVEAKSGKLSLSAQRGGYERTCSDLEELLGSAYKQARRTMKYIQDTDVPTFTDEAGNIIFELVNKSFYTDIILINTTLDSLEQYSVSLNSAKKLGFIKDREWPWSIFIHDLRIISEILEFPTQFLVYLKRRLRANDHPAYAPFDETDSLMYYLKQGLYFENDQLKGLARFSITGYTDELDRYYDYLAGRVANAPKPSLHLPHHIKELINQLEDSAKPKFTRITTFLLEHSFNALEGMSKAIDELISRNAKDRKPHDITIYPEKGVSIGLTVAVFSNDGIDHKRKYNDFAEIKKYQLQLSNWYTIYLEIDSDRNISTDFDIISYKWRKDSDLDKRLAVFNDEKLQAFKKNNIKLGRNDPCWCHSGKKYKKCHGKP